MTFDEVIKYLEEMVEIGETYDVSRVEEDRQLLEWLKELKQLREQTRWILCSEKMPTEHEWVGTKRFGTTISDEVYVTFENPKGERFAEHLRFQNGALSPHMKNEIDSWSKGSKPIAWMPEPKPYMGEGSDKE